MSKGAPLLKTEEEEEALDDALGSLQEKYKNWKIIVQWLCVSRARLRLKNSDNTKANGLIMGEYFHTKRTWFFATILAWELLSIIVQLFHFAIDNWCECAEIKVNRTFNPNYILLVIIVKHFANTKQNLTHTLGPIVNNIFHMKTQRCCLEYIAAIYLYIFCALPQQYTHKTAESAV